MSELTYHLSQEKQNGKRELILKISHPTLKGFTRPSVLGQARTASERQALEMLVWGSSASDTAILKNESSFSCLKGLSSTGRLFYEGRKIVVDPFTPFTFSFTIEWISSQSAKVGGLWTIGAQSGTLQDCALFILAKPSWMLLHGILRPMEEELSVTRLRPLLSASHYVLEGGELVEFLEEVMEDPTLLNNGKSGAFYIDPLPFLVLTDRHGAFANLWFDYGLFGKVPAHAQQSCAWRKKEVEKGWEKDLLETDFSYKIVNDSHYFCPLDKVGKSLTFLLEIGWSIFDAKGRRVYRQQQEDLAIEECRNGWILRGHYHYNEHRASLRDVVGAFNRQEHFVELSPQAIGLLDRGHIAKRWEEYTQEEWVGDGMRVPTMRLGLLSSLAEEGSTPVQIQQILTRLTTLTPSTPAQCGPDFRATLFAYQQEGLSWLKFLEEGDLGGLLADEMGLGKTVQVLAFFSQLSFDAPSLVVVPTSLLFHWKCEITRFFPSCPLYVHAGKERACSLDRVPLRGIILTSYALLRLEATWFQSMEYQCIVLDEGQTIKNPESQIAKTCYQLKSKMRLVITGTPIENHSEDLWSLFQFLLPGLLGERKTFQSEMVASQADPRFLQRVKKKIRPFILRRKKEEVALELPPKFEQTIYVEMHQEERALYEEWLQKTQGGLLKKVQLDGASSHRMEILEAILRLRQFCAHPWLLQPSFQDLYTASAKYERLFADLRDVVEEKHKVLIYSQFTQMLQWIGKGIEEQGYSYVYLDGSTQKREEVVRSFQEDPAVSIFLISLKAGGVGLNLTAADYVFLYEPWWNAAVEQQAIDRAHRVGKKSPVIARRYINALSIEEKIMHLKALKTAISQSLLDGTGEPISYSLDELLTLLT